MRTLILFLTLAGCTRHGSGDSLVVVTVDSAQPLGGVSVHATATAGGMTKSIDVAGPLDFPPTHDFGVQLARSIVGDLSVHVEALDSSGATVASGDATATIEAGDRVDVTVLLAAPTTQLDGGSDGGAPGDLAPANDLATASDMAHTVIPPIRSQPIWIGPGGAASSRLNLSVGGFDTVGDVTAPSGARLQGGYFSFQTN